MSCSPTSGSTFLGSVFFCLAIIILPLSSVTANLTMNYPTLAGSIPQLPEIWVLFGTRGQGEGGRKKELTEIPFISLLSPCLLVPLSPCPLVPLSPLSPLSICIIGMLPPSLRSSWGSSYYILTVKEWLKHNTFIKQ